MDAEKSDKKHQFGIATHFWITGKIVISRNHGIDYFLCTWFTS